MLRHAAFDRAVDAKRLIAVDEIDALFLKLLHLLFAHRAAHHVRLAERVTRQALKHLHDLLLIDHAAIGDFQDRFEQRVLIGHLFRMVAAFDIARDGLHRPRPVQRHNRGDILDGRGAQAGDDVGDTRAFQLEHSHR